MEDTQFPFPASQGTPEKEGGSDAPPSALNLTHDSTVLTAGAAPLPRTASVSHKETRILRGSVPAPTRSLARGLTWGLSFSTNDDTP
jgi:hypothetical protein